MKKRSLYKLGLVTLLVFPIPTFTVLWFVEGIYPLEIFDLKSFNLTSIALGTALGLCYALLALVLMELPVFQKLPIRIETIVQNMRLRFIDCLFLSICAGVGEELLFRSGIQFYIGPIVASIGFVAIHGYLNPKNWRVSLYGLIILPFIFAIAYGFISYGLWFAIFAHVIYDLILFLSMSKPISEQSVNDSFVVPTYTEEEQSSDQSQ
ncbi:MAG: CPBP family intramembrane metalloprotease [Crocinitomicaceae bacterium]|nr:CPBP family intramembrane metalloprotease [Crocinitomicaceae bacterium]